MDWEIIYLIGVILLALVLFIKEYVSIDITAIIVAVLLMASGIVTLKQGLSGFSNEAALAILALLILGTGLESTGLIAKISGYVARFTGNSAWGILIVMLPVVAVLSAFTNNTAVVTIFLPIILSISNLKKVSASKLLMPMAFISILGGVCTLIGTSTNLLVNSIARQYEIAPFSFFEFTKIGLVLLGIGILYAILFQHRLLPARRKYIKLEDEYQLQKYLMEIRVLEGSGLVGDFPSVNNILKEADVLVMKHVDSNGTINFPYDDLPVAEGDKLLVQVDPRKILDLKQKFNVSIQKIEDREILESDLENQLIEVVVTPGSWLVKKRIKSIDFTDRYDAVPLGISHSGKDIGELGKIKIKAGDTLLLETNQNIFNTQAIKNDFVLLNQISTAYSVKKRLVIVDAQASPEAPAHGLPWQPVGLNTDLLRKRRF
jgi:di/tricarboxylate transporter